ncbi:O-unit flippase-like protein [Photorhabdus tasmaniensis]
MKKIDITWGYLAQLLNIGSGILLLPILVITLTPEDLGFWYIFTAIYGLAQLLEFGFQPTIARQASYVYNGAKNLIKTGLPKMDKTCHVDQKLLIDLIFSSRKIYKIISLGVSIILVFGGGFYLYSLTYNADKLDIYISWFIYALSGIIIFYFGYYNALLQGRGDITEVNKIIAISRLCMAILAIILLLSKFGLYAMAISNLASCILNRFLANKAFYVKESTEIKKAKTNNDLTLILWGSSWRLGCVQLGAFLIQRGSIFIVTYFWGVSAAASYGLTIQVFMLLSSLSSLVFQIQLPKMNALQAHGMKEHLRYIYSSAMIISLCLFILGSILLVLIGPFFLSLIGSNANLIEGQWLTLLSFVMLLELNHSLSATYLTTLNEIPFLNASLYSGIAVVLVSSFICYGGWFGLGGVILGQGIVQLTFNNWYWSLKVNKLLGINYIWMLKYGTRRIIYMLKEKTNEH